MATELDHTAIKTRIVDILQANTTLYTTTAEADKLRSIQIGHPQSHRWKEDVYPYAFVSYKNERNQLISTRQDQEINGIHHIVTYEIYFVVNEADSRDAEEALDGFQKLILETLEAKNTLSDPADDTDPKCIFSIPSVDGPINETIAKEVQGRIISLVCHMRTADTTQSGAGEISEFVNSSNITLTNSSHSLLFKNMFNVRVFITADVTRRVLTDRTVEKRYEPRDYAIEADIFLTQPEIGTWVGYTSSSTLPDLDTWLVAFPDKAGNRTSLSTNLRLKDLIFSGRGNDDTIYHVRLESDTGAVAVL